MTISVGIRVGIRIVRGHEDAPEGRDQGGAGEHDQEELVQDPGYFPPLLANDLPPLFGLVPLLHDDAAEVLPWILLLPLLKHHGTNGTCHVTEIYLLNCMAKTTKHVQFNFWTKTKT